jgi:hypothetical protein
MLDLLHSLPVGKSDRHHTATVRPRTGRPNGKTKGGTALGPGPIGKAFDAGS